MEKRWRTSALYYAPLILGSGVINGWVKLYVWVYGQFCKSEVSNGGGKQSEPRCKSFLCGARFFGWQVL